MLQTILTVVGVLLVWKVVKLGFNLFASLFIIIGMVMQEAYRKDGGDQK